ncbi:MAG: cyclodeaminase/cyclohydrolase family protein [Oscillospiraceae bacterium]|nr:cyclodeaminase/cyclohydrolase family protein [Oscillospiraceae bacterium]
MAESFGKMTVEALAERLASASPTPGGGGAAALCGALAAALGGMAARLTEGKKKFLPFEADHRRIIASCDALRMDLLGLMDADAAGFAPLAQVYAMDRSLPDYRERLRQATLDAAAAPYAMVARCRDMVVLLEELRGKCSALLLSDVGCAAALAGAAMECAAINVWVNTRTLPEDDEARALKERTAATVAEFGPRAAALAKQIADEMKGE